MMAIIKKVMREVTQEDLDLNPSMVEEGIKVGDRMKLAPLPEAGEEEDEDEESSEEESAPAKGKTSSAAPTSISFTIKDANSPTGTSIRTFDAATHGEDFADLANQFEQANTLVKPTDMTDTEEVNKCIEFNKNIKHQVLSKQTSPIGDAM